jgi:hypothetical protein
VRKDDAERSRDDWRARARHRLAEIILNVPRFESGHFHLDSQRARVERQVALLAYAIGQPWDFCATIQFNVHLTPDVVLERIQKFGARCDRIWLGKRRHKFPPEKRSVILPIVETGSASGGTHVHVLVRRPKGHSPRPAWQEGQGDGIGGVMGSILKQRARVPTLPRGKSGPCTMIRYENRRPKVVSWEEQSSLRRGAMKRRVPRATTSLAEGLTAEFTTWGRRTGFCPRGDILFQQIPDNDDDVLRVAKYILKAYARTTYRFAVPVCLSQ